MKFSILLLILLLKYSLFVSNKNKLSEKLQLTERLQLSTFLEDMLQNELQFKTYFKLGTNAHEKQKI
jgi:hypothetical protein